MVRAKKNVVISKPDEPVVAEPAVAEAVAEPAIAESVAEPVKCDEFCNMFANLAMKLPQSIRKQIATRLVKKNIDTSDDKLSASDVLIVNAALEHANVMYIAKRQRAALSSKLKRAARQSDLTKL